MEKATRFPKILAHRGDLESGPENTQTALEGAAEKGADGVEIDIRMTKDGKIVLFHDEGISRVAPAFSGMFRSDRIADLSWEELSQVRLPFAGHLLRPFPPGGYQDENECYLPQNMTGEGDERKEEILLFEDFLVWLTKQRNGFLAEVEYKASGMMEEAARLLEKYNAAERCIIFSGERDKNREIQQWCKKNGKPEGLRLGANIRFLTVETRKEMEDYDLWEAGLNARTFGEEEIRWLSDRGTAVFSNLGDTPDWWEQMTGSGTAAFKTNCTGPYRKWRLKRYGI